MPQDYLKKILAAHVYDVAIESPLEAAPKLSERVGCKVYLKREDLQPVFSFKLRGAYNRIAQLSEDDAQHGVIAASAGNHAQGVALSGSKLGINTTIVMPRTTPSIKVSAVRRLGGKALLHGDSYDEAAEHGLKLSREKGMNWVHPYDDPNVIAGQGTIALELLRQARRMDYVFVPVGGGGLLAGIAACLKSIRPSIKVIAVEPEDAACFKAAMTSGRRVTLKEVGLFADGVAVRQIGKEPFKVARKLVDGVVTASVDEICSAIRDLFEENRTLAEPAGALAVAGMKKFLETNEDPEAVAVAIESGANVNFDRLRHIAERAELGEQGEMLLAVTIPERPGAFLAFLKQLGRRSITEFNYRYAHESAAHIFVGVRLQGGEGEREELLRNLERLDYPVVDLSENEMAKLHVRYMVGGRVQSCADEVLFRFEFPERPGALQRFLNQVSGRWNISLFHYRNHGAAFGRVLVGLQVPRGDMKRCHSMLDKVGYRYWEETGNPAYDRFLGNSIE